jgi:hypothetical protein
VVPFTRARAASSKPLTIGHVLIAVCGPAWQCRRRNSATADDSSGSSGGACVATCCRCRNGQITHDGWERGSACLRCGDDPGTVSVQ